MICNDIYCTTDFDTEKLTLWGLNGGTGRGRPTLSLLSVTKKIKQKIMQASRMETARFRGGRQGAALRGRLARKSGKDCYAGKN